MDFEKKLTRLEEIVQKMEKGDIALEQSLKLFEEGIQLSRDCQSQLTDAENKIKILVAFDEQKKPITQDFNNGES
jgi:exodeoxyribonuclease VII small subunit